jgi:hypothetical protein
LEPAASGGARAPLASSTSGKREHHCHQHRAWVGRAGGARDGRVREAHATGREQAAAAADGACGSSGGSAVHVQDGAATRCCDRGGGGGRDKDESFF